MEIWKKVTKQTTEFQGFKCDTCGEKDFYAPITISYGYGSDLDGETYHFCKESCAIKFLTDELRKKNPETRFITGKEKK